MIEKEPGFYKIDENAVIPQRATELSAGYDLHALCDVNILPKESARIQTGVYHVIPKDLVGLLFLRSGWAYKNRVIIPNSVGIIDADYTGSNCEIMVQLINISEKTVEIKKHQRIAQIVYTPWFMIGANENIIKKRDGGLGSTGN